MGMDVGGGGKGKVKPAMNITPLVDVVLVLLIIFMVVTPLLAKQFWVYLPKNDDKKAEPPPPDPNNLPVVLQVTKDGTLKLNAEVIPKDALKEKLRRVFAAKKGDHSLFFTAEDQAPYGAAVQAMDIARSGGAIPINVLTEKPKS